MDTHFVHAYVYFKTNQIFIFDEDNQKFIHKFEMLKLKLFQANNSISNQIIH